MRARVIERMPDLQDGLNVIVSLLCFISQLLLTVPASSAVFNVSSGDVAGLIAAINAANGNGEENTIILEAGTYTLTVVDNNTDGPTGLPSITDIQTIHGAGAATTIIERDDSAPLFRIFHIAVSGELTLDRLTVRGGRGGAVGAGILNQGKLIVAHSILAENRGSTFGGGILNTGTTIITHSSVTGNVARQGGGMSNAGTVSIDNSAFTDNSSTSGAGGLHNSGKVIITNSTFARNGTGIGGGGAIDNGGQGTITNSTISDNAALFGGGIDDSGGKLELQNTVLAHNTARRGDGDDCSNESGLVTSLGNNLIGVCDIALQATDRTTDPGLGEFADDGAPGHARVSLLSDSPAIDAGNDSTCPATDQLGTPRRGICDIGAVEFYPLVNDLVAVGNVTTAFDPIPVPGGPAGSFRITAEFTNTSTQLIGHRFAEVVELSGDNLLLNADGGVGGVGARLTSPKSLSTAFVPGATETFEFVIGLQKQEPFTFFVNMLGDP